MAPIHGASLKHLKIGRLSAKSGKWVSILQHPRRLPARLEILRSRFTQTASVGKTALAWQGLEPEETPKTLAIRTVNPK